MGNRKKRLNLKKALIIGISGQDGSYLARSLIQKKYQVHGTSRDHETSEMRNHSFLNIRDQVSLYSLSLIDFSSVLNLIEHVQPDEIYHLAGQSSVGHSFTNPVETFDSIAVGTLNLLECLRFSKKPIRFYHAGSSEIFGNVEGRADEEYPVHPRSPYATSKAAAQFAVRNYREAYGLHCCSGILFNHESPLRSERFVTRKIISGAVRISRDKSLRLKLGRLDICRDWGWAPEYVEAMWAMLQKDEPIDYVIATGKEHSLQCFVEAAFNRLGLSWRDHVDIDASLFRPSDITTSCGDAALAQRQLGWQARVSFDQMIDRLVEAECQGR